MWPGGLVPAGVRGPHDLLQVGTEAEEGADVIREAFGANYQRLADLKRQYDPTNLFRHNQNITVVRTA